MGIVNQFKHIKNMRLIYNSECQLQQEENSTTTINQRNEGELCLVVKKERQPKGN